MTDATTSDPTIPNHHAHHPGFSGLSGYVAAWSFRFGRADEAGLAADLVALASGDRLVDIGCGSGAAARLAAERGATVTGVDPARVMLDVARATSRRRLGIAWATGAAEDLPLPDGGVEVAWSLATVHHWADLAGGLADVRRVLAPGGRFLAMERQVPPDADGLASHGWTPAQAARFAEDCRAVGLLADDVAVHETRRGTQLCVLARRPADGPG